MFHKKIRSNQLYLKSTKKLKVVKSNHTGHYLPRQLTSYPLLVMILLCTGVLIFNFGRFAAADFPGTSSGSYTVNVSVVPPPPTSAATITSPINGQVFQTQPITVSGSCPLNTYIQLSDNSNPSGVALCSATGTYSIQTGLFDNSNVLSVQDYSLYGSIGPSSNSVEVTYVKPQVAIVTKPPAVIVPQNNLSIVTVDNGVPFTPLSVPTQTQSIPSVIPQTSDKPTISGTSSPFAIITIIIHSDPITCTTTADSTGFWQCILPQTLQPGIHSVSITAVNKTTGAILKAPTFFIQVTKYTSPPIAQNNLRISTIYKYKEYTVNSRIPLEVDVEGGVEPYKVTIDWGDGTTTKINRKVSGNFVLDHLYSRTNGQNKAFNILMSATDSQNNQAFFQTIDVIRTPQPIVSSTINKNQFISGSGTSISTKTFEKYVWSVYGLVSVMLLCFWLGERQQINNSKRKH